MGNRHPKMRPAYSGSFAKIGKGVAWGVPVVSSFPISQG